MNKTEKAVDNYLSAVRVQFSAVYVRKNSATHDTFPGAFRWSVAFQRVGHVASAQEDFDFYMGSAHVVKGTKATPKAPCACEVIYCLLADSSAASMSFETWADECGYDADSRRALRTYEECLEQAKRLSRIFTAEERKALADLMANY